MWDTKNINRKIGNKSLLTNNLTHLNDICISPEKNESGVLLSFLAYVEFVFTK